ncbi:MAG: hypothetical protein HRU03_02535 [Nanoarchaeales archaeon]|nr:hypothetical protein [Nanoarchaeales archaeon]
MIKQIYYAQSNRIFSNKLTEIEFNILEHLPKINFDKKNKINTNKKIIEELNKILENKNNVKIRGIIENNKVNKSKIKNIEKNYNNNKLKAKQPKQDNYDFISAINSYEIIKQIEIQIKNNSQFKTLKNQIKIYTKSTTQNTTQSTNKLNEKITKQKEKLEKSKLKLKQFKLEKLNPIKKILNKCQQKLVTFNEQKEQIKIDISKKKHQNKYSIKERLKSQIEVLEEKLEKNDYKIEMLTAHIKILKEKIKLGVQKEINPLLFIVTLGLSYYRKSNTLKYKVSKQLIEITNLKERNLKIENVKKEREIYFNKLDKNHQSNLKQLIHINQSLEEIEKIQEVEELKLDTLNPKQIILKEKLEIEENKLEELNLEKNKNKKTSVNKIDKLITKIEVLFSKQKQEINNLKTNLQNQTTTINEELVIEL